MTYAHARAQRVPVSFATTLFSADKLPVRFVLIALTFLMGLLYVIQMNITATKGYEIRELESRMVSLQDQARELEFSSIQLQSMDRLLSQVQPGTLVKANPDSYVRAGATTVATAR